MDPLGQQHLEIVGRLAGGIAHQFKNLLQIIIGYNAGVLDRVTGELREDAERVQAAAERAASLTTRLLAFSGQQVLQPVPVRLDRFVRVNEEMFGALLRANVYLYTGLAEGLWTVDVDPVQMEQVLVSLIANAQDAMPQGGRLTIETENVELSGERDGMSGIPPGRYVRMAVVDEGHGMDETVKARLFEPFFTTRPQGTGLGLATVLGIVRQSKGHIRVDSEVGAGTTVHIFLPALGL